MIEECVLESRQRGDLSTGQWRQDLPPPRCQGCGEVIDSMWAIPRHVHCDSFDIIYPKDSRFEKEQVK